MSNIDVNVKRKKIRYILLVMIVLIVLGMATTSALLLSGGSTLVFKVNTPSSVVQKIASVEKTGGNLELTEGDLNALIEVAIKSDTTVGPLVFKGAYVKLNDGKLTTYVQITYGRWSFLGSTTGDLSYKDGHIFYTPSNFKIGKLGVSVNYAMKKLSTFTTAKGIVVKDGVLDISKELIPLALSNISVTGNKLILTLDASSAQTESAQTTQNEEGTISTSSEDTKVALLIKARNELYSVYDAVQTQQEKNLITQIQGVVSMMIDSPTNSFSAETAQVKANYSKLTSDEKSDIKDAIIMNMQTSTLREIKGTFGL